ncbi:uncharacterized protein LOC107261325 [Ricinus communis]|uniref:uncharacterized protein LOC107261325 n=1 Tax=Ricinus communis TaxID=3988 RepID=UPI00201B0EE7|nr:uncharacterized protein LOC107261325 [Ricinus communis]
MEKMCLAMIWAIRNLRHYFQCYKVQEIQKIDLLKYLFEALSLTGKPARWLVLLAEFEIEYITKNVITSRAVAEFLAQNAIEGDDLWDLEFPDENLGVIEIQEWKMYFDGVENAKGAGLGVIMIMLEGDMPRISKQFDFKVTNNIAEYESCLFGLKAVVGGGARQLMVYGDSMLVIQQAIEESNVKEERLKPYVNYLRTLVCNFSKCSFIHFLLDENHMVDLLVTVSSMWDKPSQLPMKPLVIMKSGAPCYQGHWVMQVHIGLEEKPWFYDLKMSIEDRVYPKEATVKGRYALQIQARSYLSNEGVLYRRMVLTVQLYCVTKVEVQVVMEEMHKGVCRSYMNDIVLTRKIMHQDYYWLTMEIDCMALARKCHECEL